MKEVAKITTRTYDVGVHYNMKEVAKITTRTYDVGGNYLVDAVELDQAYEAWLYEETNGVKVLMFGVPKEQNTYEEFLDLIEANLDEHIEVYEEEYMDGVMRGVMIDE